MQRCRDAERRSGERRGWVLDDIPGVDVRLEGEFILL